MYIEFSIGILVFLYIFFRTKKKIYTPYKWLGRCILLFYKQKFQKNGFFKFYRKKKK